MAFLATSPSANNIIRGGSRLLIKFLGDVAYYHFGYIEGLGSTPAIKVDSTYSGMGGIQRRIKTRTTMASITHVFTCKERTDRIVRAWLMGDTEVDTAQADATADTETLANITGEVDGANVLIGVYYPLAKRLLSNYSWGENVLGVDFLIEEKSGAIAFLRAVTTDELSSVVTYDCAQIAGGQFNKYAILDQQISAKIVHVFENGSVIDEDTIPLGRLIPDKDFGSGDDGSESGKDATLAFKIEQDYDPILGWGTFDQLDQG